MIWQGGGGKNDFFQIWKPRALVGGFGGMPPRIFFKMVRFG